MGAPCFRAGFCSKTIIPDSEEHPLAYSRAVPKAVLRWIRVKALAKDPDERHESAGDLVQDLASELEGSAEFEERHTVVEPEAAAATANGRAVGVGQLRKVTRTVRRIVVEGVRKGLVRPRAVALGASVIAGGVAAALFASGVLAPSSAPTAVLENLAAPPPGPVVVAVGPEAPAQIVSPLNDVTVYVGSGSVEEAVNLTYQALSVRNIPALPDGYVPSDVAFDLSVSDEEASSDGSYSFARPITITARLDAQDIFVARGEEANVVIQQYHDPSVGWTLLPTTADFGASVAHAQVASLSTFALTIRTVLAAPTPTATPTSVGELIAAAPTTSVPTATATATPAPTATPQPSATPTPGATATPVSTPTATASATPAPTATRVPSPTATREPTATPTAIPTATATPTLTPTPAPDARTAAQPGPGTAARLGRPAGGIVKPLDVADDPAAQRRPLCDQ